MFVGLLAAVSLTSCFLFENHHIRYGVHLWYYDPDLRLDPYCYGVDFKATFGENVLIDIHVDQSDLGTTTAAQELAEAPQQRYYSGMPLVIEATCRDDLGEAIGHSVYEGALISPKENAHFALLNYHEPSIDLSTCIPAIQATGVQMCAQSYGFEFE